jgi:hypothetical protein
MNPLALTLLLLFAGNSEVEPCAPPAAAVRVNHVVVAVEDLADAKRSFSGLGFTVKGGTPHDNGLHNSLVEFADTTEIELMSVETPGDVVARGYARFLNDGEGGAFLALSATADAVTRAAVPAGISIATRKMGAFRYTMFGDPGLGAVFFIEYDTPPANNDATATTHANHARGIQRVWVEASPSLEKLLAALGAVSCGPATAPDGREGTVWATASGEIGITKPRFARPRVLGVTVLQGKDAKGPIPSGTVHGIHIDGVLEGN